MDWFSTIHLYNLIEIKYLINYYKTYKMAIQIGWVSLVELIKLNLVS